MPLEPTDLWEDTSYDTTDEVADNERFAENILQEGFHDPLINQGL